MRTINLFKHSPKLILIEVPQDEDAFILADNEGSWKVFCPNKYGAMYSTGIWSKNPKPEIIGKLSEVLSSQSMCEGLVEKRDPVNGLFLIYDSAHTTDSWVNREGALNSMTRTEYGLAKESFLSRLESEGYTTSLPKAGDRNNPDFEGEMRKYGKAVSKYLDPNLFLVIKIIEP